MTLEIEIFCNIMDPPPTIKTQGLEIEQSDTMNE